MKKPRTNRKERRDSISSMLKRVSFSQTAVRVCEQEATAAQEEFLHTVLSSELANRERVRKARRLREAGFPVYKTLDEYDFQNLKLPPNMSRNELCSGNFVHEKKNIVMFGPVGTGKSHLATGLGVLACNQDKPVRFFTAAELVVRLSKAYGEGTLEKSLKPILKADLLIIDEWGYVPFDKHGAQLLFRVISDSYERRSLILTTNLEFSKWGTLFSDDQMAAAMIDRLAHHGYIFVFEGESYRMKHALMRQKHQEKIPTT